MKKIVKRPTLFILFFFFFLTGCANSLALIESASKEIDFTMNSGSCRDEQWVVPGGAEINVLLTNPLDMPQIFIIMARAATPPFDQRDNDRIYFSVPVPPGVTETTFTTPAMPAEYQVICGPADNLEQLGRNLLIVVQSGKDQ
jgi:hypothetical protein